MKSTRIVVLLAACLLCAAPLVLAARDPENSTGPAEARTAPEVASAEQAAPALGATVAEAAASAEGAAVAEKAARAEEATAVVEAEESLNEALMVIEEARSALAARDPEQPHDPAAVREELSRAHRQLRDASRDIARAHREMSLAGLEGGLVPLVNLGDQAVIGLVLGRSEPAGIELIGVSPDGPAERAGLKQGDILSSIGGVSLAGQTGDSARDALFTVMQEAKKDEALPVTVLRGEETLGLNVVPEIREPLSWQSMIQLAPMGPLPPAGAAAPCMALDRGEVVQFDDEAMAERIKQITERAQKMQYRFVGEDGNESDFRREVEVEDGPLSPVGRRAMGEADMLFGPSHTLGLELTKLNPELGKYFKAERGVLVIRAVSENAYGLVSGDVISAVGKTAVNTPSDLMRALRELEPGSKIELSVKRDKRDHTLTATVPENLLGMARMPRAG